jgi:hypothetical protein
MISLARIAAALLLSSHRCGEPRGTAAEFHRWRKLGTGLPRRRAFRRVRDGLHLDAHVEFPSLPGASPSVSGRGGYIGFSEGNDSLRFAVGAAERRDPLRDRARRTALPHCRGGIYNVNGDLPHDGHTHDENETLFGVNFGVGFSYRHRRLNTFVEARFHNVFEDDEALRFIPLTIGIRF